MRFYLLHEAKKPTNRSQIKQRLDYEHRGLPAKGPDFAARMPWQQKVAAVFKEMDLDGDQHQAARRRVMSALKGVAHKKGNAYLQKMAPSTFKGAIRKMLQDYDLQRSRPVAHQRPGVSNYDLNTHPGVHFGPDRQMRMNLGDIEDPHTISARELKGHYHPDLQRIGRAVDTEKEDYRKDRAVVHDLDGVPYYIFIRPYKSAPGHVTGTNKFAPMLPADMHFVSKGLTFDDLKKYFKSAKWNRLLSNSENFVPLESPKEYPNFEEAITRLQEKAWKKAYNWFVIRQALSKWELQLERLEKKEKAIQAQTGGGLSPEDEEKHSEAYEHAHQSRRALIGKAPDDKLTGNRRAFRSAYANVASTAKEAFMWYVWLMASEHEYGTRLADRRKLFPGYSAEPAKTKRHKSQWTIQPPRTSENYQWDKTILKGLGYHGNDWDRFTRHLRKSNYNFVNSNEEIRRLWVPLVGNLRERFGLKLHPQNIADYLAHSKLAANRDLGIVGRKTNKLHVRATLNGPVRTFIGGNQQRQFALIPAVIYLQYFDSPFHGGERLIQGREKFSLPVARKLARKSGSSWNPQTQNKMKLRSAAYRERKRATGWEPKIGGTLDRFDHENMDARRKRADIIDAERILQRKKENERVAEIMARKTRKRTPIKKYGYNPVPTGVALNQGLSPLQRRALRAQAKREGKYVHTTPFKATHKRAVKSRTTNISQRRRDRIKEKREREKRLGFV
jgi:hypothetical protein